MAWGPGCSQLLSPRVLRFMKHHRAESVVTQKGGLRGGWGTGVRHPGPLGPPREPRTPWQGQGTREAAALLLSGRAGKGAGAGLALGALFQTRALRGALGSKLAFAGLSPPSPLPLPSSRTPLPPNNEIWWPSQGVPPLFLFLVGWEVNRLLDQSPSLCKTVWGCSTCSGGLGSWPCPFWFVVISNHSRDSASITGIAVWGRPGGTLHCCGLFFALLGKFSFVIEKKKRKKRCFF